jgi:hypothetical protein
MDLGQNNDNEDTADDLYQPTPAPGIQKTTPAVYIRAHSGNIYSSYSGTVRAVNIGLKKCAATIGHSEPIRCQFWGRRRALCDEEG